MGIEIADNRFIRYEDERLDYSIPEGVTAVGDLAFSGADRLVRLTLPESIESIGNYAFLNCYGLQEIRMPERVSHIGTGLFQNCWKLTSVAFPEGLENLGGEMLDNCHALRRVYLPDSLEHLERTAFNKCRSIREIYISPERMHILPAPVRNIAVITYMSHHDDGGPCDAVDEYAESKQRLLIDLAVNRRDTNAVRYMLEHGIADAETVMTYLSKSAATNRVEITALLLEYSRGMTSVHDEVLDPDPFD